MTSRDKGAEDGVIDGCTNCALPFPVLLSRLNGATSPLEPLEPLDGDGVLILLGFATSIRQSLSACSVANVMINRTNDNSDHANKI